MKRISSGGAAAFVLTIMIAILGSGCKENTLIDARVDPNHNNGLTYAMTFGTLTQTVEDDSVSTSLSIGGIAMYVAAGTIARSADPYFGQTTAIPYFQVVPGSLGFNFSGYIVDSAVLILPFSSSNPATGFIWGDTTDPSATQRFTVYRSDSLFATSTDFYPSTPIMATSAISDPVTVNINALRDSVNVDGGMQAPHLRIPLNSTFINYITQGAASNFASYSSFLNYFRGLYVLPDTTSLGKALPYFRLDESGAGTSYSKAGIIFYYRNTQGTTDTTFNFYFNSSYCSHFNHFNRDKQGVTPLSGNVVQLQNQPGDAIDVKIYGLRKLLITDSITHLVKVPIINKAELDISVVGTPNAHQDSLFSPPTLLYAEGIADSPTGSFTYFIADRYPITSLSALSILDGYPHYNASTNQTTYTLNIPREIQNAVIRGSDTVHLRINGTKDYYGAYRLVAGGGNYSDTARQLKLKVVYSKLK